MSAVVEANLELQQIAARLADDAGYRSAILRELERGQFAEFRRYWAFEEEHWYRKHLDEVRRRAELFELLSYYAPLRGARVLVIGAGFGAEAIALAHGGAKVIACDLDPALLRFTARRASEHGVDFQRVHADGLHLPLRLASCDWVILRQVLEHVPRATQVPLLHSAAAMVKPGGHLFVDTPNRRDPIDRHDTGLPFVHWLPRRLRARLARRFGRDVPTFEPGAGGAQVGVHDFVSLGEVLRALPEFSARSRYKEYPDLHAWAEHRARQGRRPRVWRRLGLVVATRYLALERVTAIRLVLQRRDRNTG